MTYAERRAAGLCGRNGCNEPSVRSRCDRHAAAQVRSLGGLQRRDNHTDAQRALDRRLSDPTRVHVRHLSPDECLALEQQMRATGRLR